MTTFTRQEVRELAIDEFGLGRRGTNTGTSQTAITDDPSFGGPGAAEGLEIGCEVLITSGTGAPHDEWARLNSLPVRTTGIMQLDRTLTVALANTDTFEVLFPGLSFDGGLHSVHQCMNDVLAEFPFEKRTVPVTMIADGDMLKSTYADWAAGGTATIDKVAGGFPTALRGLVVGAAANSDYARSGDYGVEAGESYYYEATGYWSSAYGATDGTLILYDSSNSANITLANTVIDVGDPIILVNSAVKMPSGCKIVQARLQTDTSSGTIIWANVILRKNDAREFTVQDRPVRIQRLGNLLATKESNWGRRAVGLMETVPHDLEQKDVGLWQYHAKASLAGWSVWYEEYLEPAAMTADDDTTNVNKRELAAMTAERVLRPLARDKTWRDRYEFAASAAASVRLAFDDRRAVVDQRTKSYPIATV